MQIGVFGATGQVGGVMRRLLVERDFPLDELFADFLRVFEAGVGVHARVGGTAPEQAVFIDPRQAGNFTTDDLKNFRAREARHEQPQNP